MGPVAQDDERGWMGGLRAAIRSLHRSEDHRARFPACPALDAVQVAGVGNHVAVPVNAHRAVRQVFSGRGPPQREPAAAAWADGYLFAAPARGPPGSTVLVHKRAPIERRKPWSSVNSAPRSTRPGCGSPWTVTTSTSTGSSRNMRLTEPSRPALGGRGSVPSGASSFVRNQPSRLPSGL